MTLFEDTLIQEFQMWKKANPTTFSWWSFVNMKADLQTALGFAKFFYPDVVEVDGYFLLADTYNERRLSEWIQECGGDKSCVEKMMNLYEVNDFFKINQREDETEEQVDTLGRVLQLFWTMSFKQRFPTREIVVDLFRDNDENLFITVYERI
ncbi:MAG: hypothetical protein K6T81_21000 [Alicyclobacillus macrosporangiidus]|uniref:hypothetical protein n=1 Tax=Alicyclobacillus macrosporangiidus TaxID=392015 RepID=UPI0026F2E792|nr:hypothetical protein [Alicyclobacillus macrosporangiidus]MCL6601186.1 hypothetical protein [Alicyclobacillus macrosporangiidus]